MNGKHFKKYRIHAYFKMQNQNIQFFWIISMNWNRTSEIFNQFDSFGQLNLHATLSIADCYVSMVKISQESYDE